MTCCRSLTFASMTAVWSFLLPRAVPLHASFRRGQSYFWMHDWQPRWWLVFHQGNWSGDEHASHAIGTQSSRSQLCRIVKEDLICQQFKFRLNDKHCELFTHWKYWCKWNANRCASKRKRGKPEINISRQRLAKVAVLSPLLDSRVKSLFAVWQINSWKNDIFNSRTICVLTPLGEWWRHTLRHWSHPICGGIAASFVSMAATICLHLCKFAVCLCVCWRRPGRGQSARSLRFTLQRPSEVRMSNAARPVHRTSAALQGEST